MAEWWNLDQALIWIATRDLEQVGWAQGDAGCRRERAFGYICLDDPPDPDAEAIEDEGPITLLQSILCDPEQRGLIRAVLGNDKTAAPLPSSIFEEYKIEPHDMQLAFVFAAPRGPLYSSRDTLPALLNRADILTLFPPLAPDHLVRGLGALTQDPKPEPAPYRSKSSLRTEAIFREKHPDGLPRGESYGKRKAAIAEIQKQVSAEGLEPLSHKSIERLDRKMRELRS